MSPSSSPELSWRSSADANNGGECWTHFFLQIFIKSVSKIRSIYPQILRLPDSWPDVLAAAGLTVFFQSFFDGLRTADISVSLPALRRFLITPWLYNSEQKTCHYFRCVIPLTINMNCRKHLMDSLQLPKRCPARGEGKCVDPGVFFINSSSSATKKDGLVVAGSSNKYGRSFL